MPNPWQLLRDGGVPLTLARSGAAPAESELALAVREAMASHPTGREAEALAAWVIAWRDHWPTGFARSFGAEASSVAEWALTIASDEGRYIKLRRIALENLASII